MQPEDSAHSVPSSPCLGIETADVQCPPNDPRGQNLNETYSTGNPSEDVISSLEVPHVVLSDEQRGILEQVKLGKNVFFTGSAGTGKSVLLREIIKTLGPRPSSRLVVTASTGVASVNIGGTTLHSWAGIGLGQESGEILAKTISEAPSRRKAKERWITVRCLIIDES
ncbi:PIF1-like helicase-domain-containing protein [Amylostereum chailletii]|nr:PIF1-like helicase-domain-containing protein [Amylostereum chailletii]